MRVEATYNKRSYELREAFEQPDDGPWTYEVHFKRTQSSLITSLQELFSGTRPHVLILLPPDVPLNLKVNIAEGGSSVELGGMWITEAAFEVHKGGFDLSVYEPLRQPMNRLSVDVSMGGFAMRTLGNASPRELDLDCRMGGMDIDLRGEWVADADITLRSSMGGGSIRLPDNVNVEGVEVGGVPSPAEPEIGLPTLRFSASSRMGDLEIIR